MSEPTPEPGESFQPFWNSSSAFVKPTGLAQQ
ncbi:hypothetical protein KIPB_016901, partial [Kipferlia bialata]|eukprot:g16901.t1